MSTIEFHLKTTVRMITEDPGCKMIGVSLSSCEVLDYEVVGDCGEVADILSWSCPDGIIETLWEQDHCNGVFKVDTKVKVSYYRDYWGEVDCDITYKDWEVVEV